jgi:hypothetical protein
MKQIGTIKENCGSRPFGVAINIRTEIHGGNFSELQRTVRYVEEAGNINMDTKPFLMVLVAVSI